MSESIDLILTDIVMPKMKGPELVGKLAANDPDLRVLYISGYPDEWALLEACLTEEEALLQKPFTTDVLLRKVREVLDHKTPCE
jgi:DNA-binding NtrC family response regulator